MKDYREMAQRVLERRDVYVAERRKRMKKTVSILSCFCLVILLGAGAWYGNKVSSGSQTDLDGGNMDGDPAGYSAGISDLEKQFDVQAGIEEEGQTDSLADASQADHEIGVSSCEGDKPAEDSLVSTGNLRAYEKVWGGSYIDNEGRTVVLLTEDTEENRQKVFEMNPELLESSTVFQKADYSLMYLTKLQEAISDMMMEGELPFVTTSALMEDANHIRVTVTTESQEDLERLMAIDSTGGAIEVVYNPEGGVKEDLAVKEESEE